MIKNLKNYVPQILKKYKNNTPITMVTSYDSQTASIVKSSNIDMILVGDSVSMINMGNSNTIPVTMDEMIHYSKCVFKGTSATSFSYIGEPQSEEYNKEVAITPLLVGDMPYGSYEYCNKEAVKNAIRFIKEGGMDAIKLEGNRPSTISNIVNAGVPVMGHIGLTPQHISSIGGFKSQGKDSKGALKLINDAIELQKSGCFALVIECVPEPVSEIITQKLSIPTIGIGSGSKTSGQVLVINDLIGMTKNSPKFSKRYSNVGEIIRNALSEYKNDVENRKFPSSDFSPYKISQNELDIIKKSS